MGNALARPIFIVGCQRSGTTLLRLILDSHSKISCGPETRFLEDMERIVGRDWNRLSQYGFTKEEWLARVSGFFGGIQGDYALSRGKSRWADKSPRYALHLPFIMSLFPDAQIVHLIRDGRDVAVSHRKRFGYWSSVKSSMKWPRYIEAARAGAAGLPASQYYELRYESLVGESEKTLRELFEYLGEEWEPAVMQFDLKPHDVPPRYHRQLASRQAAAAESDAMYGSRVGTYRSELDPLVRLLFWWTARDQLKTLGY